MAQNCMNKYRNEFAINFAKLMEKELPTWKEYQREGRKALYTSWLGWYFGAFALGFVPGKRETNYVENLHIHFWFGVVLFIGSIISAIGIENKSYQKLIKQNLFPNLLNVFSKGIQYPGYGLDKLQYNKSQLLKKPVTDRETDDCFQGVYNGVRFKIEETELQHVKRAKRRKDDVITTLFKGLAMYFNMEKEINARVIISSKSLFKKKSERL